MEVVDIMEVAVMAMAITMEEGQEDLEVQVDLEDQVDQAVLKEQACQVQEQSVTNSTLAMMFQTPRLVNRSQVRLILVRLVARSGLRPKIEPLLDGLGTWEMAIFSEHLFFNTGHPHGHPMGPIS